MSTATGGLAREPEPAVGSSPHSGTLLASHVGQGCVSGQKPVVGGGDLKSRNVLFSAGLDWFFRNCFAEAVTSSHCVMHHVITETHKWVINPRWPIVWCGGGVLGRPGDASQPKSTLISQP